MALLVAATLAPSTVGWAVAPASAAAQDPGISEGRPVPGQVVQAGTVELSAVLTTSVGVGEATLLVDGEEHEARIDWLEGDDRRLVATVALTTGHHIVTVRFTDLEGRVAQHAWRFAASDLEVQRLAGSDRVATAVALSRDRFEDGAAAGAVIATARDFPDGLAAAPLAVHLGGPLLLSERDTLSPATADELRRAVEPGSEVVLLGGSSALSDDVAAAITGLGFEAVRVAGAGRSETAAAIARRLPPASTVFVTSGRGFADGLAVSAPAARDGSPILLTEPTALPAATRDVLVDLAPERIVVVGGSSAVSLDVQDALRDLAPRVDRIAGADRYATAAAVVQAFYADPAPTAVGLASGEDFPDALAGGSHAGALGMPLLLSRSDAIGDAQVALVATMQPGSARLYGGHGALDAVVVSQLRAAVLDGPDGPVVTTRLPGPGADVNALDVIELGLDRGVDLDHSTLHVTVDGLDVPGVTAQGDFTDRMVFQVGDLPIEPRPDVGYPVEVTGQAYDGTSWRHVSWQFTYRKLDLGRGDSGAEVLAIQDRLTALGYWLGEPDGKFGPLTSQALMAFQKYEGLERTGVADGVTRGALEVATRPLPTAVRSGRWVEIDKTRQVMLFVVDGVVEWAMNTSTGTEGPYTRPDGSTGTAHTPEGWFSFYRQIDGLREADLGQMWRPKYFTSAGHAIHGSTSIPAYPASHGCARLSYPAIDFVWSAGLAPIGTPLYVHQ